VLLGVLFRAGKAVKTSWSVCYFGSTLSFDLFTPTRVRTRGPCLGPLSAR